jgi:hypothetical protein
MAYLTLLVAMVLFCGLAHSAAHPALASVWVASPWEQVSKTATPGLARDIQLSAARNEYEPARIIVTAGSERLHAVSAKAGPLTGPGGKGIAVSNLRFFREHYLNIDKPSHRSAAAPGWYPDPLVPFPDHRLEPGAEKAQYHGAPFDVEAGCSQGVWVDVYVPRNVPAGEYRGAITVTSAGKTLARIPLSLIVFDFTLPDTFAMRSNFGSLGDRLARQLGMEAESEQFAQVEDLYIDELLAHQCQPSSLGRIWPEWSPEKGIDDTRSEARLRRMVEQRHANSLMVPFRYQEEPDECAAYLRAMEAYLKREGFLDLSYIYMLDEPNTAEQYEAVRQQGKLIHEAAPGIKRLCTEQPQTDDPAFGDLYGAVDIWCPLWPIYDEAAARARQSLGESIWTYTALCQASGKIPFWEIDFPPVMYRAPFWTCWRYDITGILYWSSIWWKDPAVVWERPVYPEGEVNFWGEGVLLYPGQPAGVEGPVPSIRLKLIREAMEDYEYMSLAAEAAGKAEVDQVVATVARSFSDWESDPGAYLRARAKLAKLIEGRHTSGS